MDKLAYYTKMNASLGHAISNGIVLQGDYVCPLCMQSFSQDDVRNVLTEEDVPQEKLGGSRIALTCRDCNSGCGSEIDIHLLNSIVSNEQRMFLPGTDRSVRIEKDGKVLNAELKVGEGQTMELLVNTKRNNPAVWDDFHDNILLPDASIELEDKLIKKEERRAAAAIIKNAYLLLFAKTGYAFLADKYYDAIRRQIAEPLVYHLPERLWTMQSLYVPDGIYITQDNRYRGFFVVYTLRKILRYKVCVLIPVPNLPYIAATKQLEQFEAGTRIRTLSLPNLDYLADSTAIYRLRNWVYGWDMEF